MYVQIGQVYCVKWPSRDRREGRRTRIRLLGHRVGGQKSEGAASENRKADLAAHGCLPLSVTLNWVVWTDAVERNLQVLTAVKELRDLERCQHPIHRAVIRKYDLDRNVNPEVIIAKCVKSQDSGNGGLRVQIIVDRAQAGENSCLLLAEARCGSINPDMLHVGTLKLLLAQVFKDEIRVGIIGQERERGEEPDCIRPTVVQRHGMTIALKVDPNSIGITARKSADLGANAGGGGDVDFAGHDSGGLQGNCALLADLHLKSE